MNLALWIIQVVLAAVFAFSAATKGFLPRERLLAMGQTGVGPVPMPLVRTVAFTELLAVLGLILPWATGIARALTPTAAVGLGVVMVGAATIHSKLREPKNVAANLVLLAACATVAIGRFSAL